MQGTPDKDIVVSSFRLRITYRMQRNYSSLKPFSSHVWGNTPLFQISHMCTMSRSVDDISPYRPISTDVCQANAGYDYSNSCVDEFSHFARERTVLTGHSPQLERALPNSLRPLADGSEASSPLRTVWRRYSCTTGTTFMQTLRLVYRQYKNYFMSRRADVYSVMGV